MPELEEWLNASISRSRKWGRANYYTAYAVLVIAVLGSIAATLSIVFDFSRETSALLAAVPGIAIIVNNSFKFEHRSRWHWNKTRRLNELMRALKFENVPPDEISKQWTQFYREIEDQWPGFGTLPTQPGQMPRQGP